MVLWLYLGLLVGLDKAHKMIVYDPDNPEKTFIIQDKEVIEDPDEIPVTDMDNDQNEDNQRE